jgi:hypothetical protein
MKNILAENLLRFGVKNLDKSLTRTFLNEGLQPGELGYGGSAVDTTNWPSNIGSNFAKYSNIIAPGGFKSGATFFAGAMVAAIYEKYAKDKKLQKLGFDALSSNIELITLVADSIQYSNQAVEVFPSPKVPTQVATIGSVNGTGTKETPGSVKGTATVSSEYIKVINFLNRFNFTNVTNGQTYLPANEQPDYNQYDLSEMVNSVNYVNLYKTTIATKSLIWYTPTNKQPNVAGKETGTEVVGAQAPQPKAYDVSFETDSSNIPANDPEVAKAVQDAIAMFPDGNISNLTVISSASPEYNNRAGGPKTLADYGQTPLSGTGKPAAGTDFKSKNIELAYNRGVSFMNALNAGLTAQGKPQVAKYTIQWQISDKGGVKVPGRFAQVNWEKAGTPGKEGGTMQSTGTEGGVISGKETFTIFQHKFTWQGA